MQEARNHLGRDELVRNPLKQLLDVMLHMVTMDTRVPNLRVLSCI